MYIPYGRQSINDEDIAAVVETLKSDFLTTGPKVQEFEEKIAAYTGVKYAVAVANGTAALHVACLAAGIGAGDEVITTALTFAASANCVLYCGGRPVFADVDPDTYNIDPADIERKITEKTKAIIPVHFTGQPCDMDEIHRIAKKHGLLVIEDGAHALGAEYKGKIIGGLSDMTTISFHPVKHITTGEGGIVLTNNAELYKRLSLFRTHGITRDTSLMTENEGDWYYQQLVLGYNYRISDIQCALGISQLKRLPEFLEKRREIAKRYDKALLDMPEYKRPKQLENTKNSWHLYVIQTPENRRKKIFDGMRNVGIGANVHYIPVYKHPYYQKNGYRDVFCKNAEKIYKNLISLPIYPDLKVEEQEYVIENLEKLRE